tara:strand:- start:113 stop:535 length:423 start_codon:yes stop_codon:yes gene_type:complete
MLKVKLKGKGNWQGNGFLLIMQILVLPTVHLLLHHHRLPIHHLLSNRMVHNKVAEKRQTEEDQGHVAEKVRTEEEQGSDLDLALALNLLMNEKGAEIAQDLEAVVVVHIEVEVEVKVEVEVEVEAEAEAEAKMLLLTVDE